MLSSKLRLLSFDDLYLLRYIGLGLTLTAAARELNLTQPAATQRIRKLESVFDKKIIRKDGRNISLTCEGRAISQAARDALALMKEVSPISEASVINIGSRPEAGRSWLWPCLTKLRKEQPHLMFNLSFGSGPDLLSHLGTGKLDIVLTSAPLPSTVFGSIELEPEEYIFIAASRSAKEIKEPKDLEGYTLIEHDRSFPFASYLAAGDKLKLKYKDVWFVESSELIADAVIRDLGVGIVPKYLVRRQLKEGKVVPLKFQPQITLASDSFRLIFRKDRDLAAALQQLSQSLIKLGLR